MKLLKTALLSLVLTAASTAAMDARAATVAASLNPVQITALFKDIQTAINALPADAPVLTIEASINGAMAKDAFSASIDLAALKVAQTAYPAGTNASIAIAALASAGALDNTPRAGGDGGVSPIGSPVAGSQSGSGYLG